MPRKKSTDTTQKKAPAKKTPTRKQTAPKMASTRKYDVHPGGRPSIYSDDIVREICERIARGESLVSICKDERMPSRFTVLSWLGDGKHDEFVYKYAQARDAQADFYFDEIVNISDEQNIVVETHEGTKNIKYDLTAVQAQKLRIDARKWVASKLSPRKYGNKVEVETKIDVGEASLERFAQIGMAIMEEENKLREIVEQRQQQEDF